MDWFKKSKGLSRDEKKHLKSIVGKIMRGDRDWTLEELQFQQNHSAMVEEVLMEKHNEIT